MEDDKKDNQIHWDNAKYFVIAFLLLLLAAYIGYGTGIRATKEVHAEEMAATKLVYIQPYGCDELCVNLSVNARIVADEAELVFKHILLPSPMAVPGVFVMNSTEMSLIFPFDTEASLREIMCVEYEYNQFC